MDDKYIEYRFLSSLSGWKDRWFYIGNHKPALLERTGGVLKPQPARNQNPPLTKMSQVNELIVLIQALKEMRVTGAFAMYSFFERRIQPL
jgi:hypothetical protein